MTPSEFKTALLELLGINPRNIRQATIVIDTGPIITVEVQYVHIATGHEPEEVSTLVNRFDVTAMRHLDGWPAIERAVRDAADMYGIAQIVEYVDKHFRCGTLKVTDEEWVQLTQLLADRSAELEFR